MIKVAPFNLKKLYQSRDKNNHQDINPDSYFKQLVSQIKQVCDKNQQIYEKLTSNSRRMEDRLQDVLINTPQLGNNAKQRSCAIEQWMITVCKTVFSVGFKMYESGVLDTNKVKAYCSENILRNLLMCSQKNHLTLQQLQNINNLLQKDLLPYLCHIYPESEETETSAKFSADLIERDAMQDNQYQLVYRSKIDFSYKASGNYNSAIMKFINYLLDLTRVKQQNQVQLNALFQKDMTQLFRKVESQENLLNMLAYNPKSSDLATKSLKIDPISQKQKQQYQQKVRQYTNFKIGQKLSKNLTPYSEKQIQSQNLSLRNSEVIRVITKWCEELEEVYKTKALVNREVAFRMKNGQQKYLSLYERFRLEGLLLDEKQKVVMKTKDEINQNNFKNQSELLKTPLFQQLSKFSKADALIGQFCSIIYKNNADYLITYLNALIHGINKATRNYSISNQNQTANKTSQVIPELINFKIGDLMRCRCESRQTQIIALYKQIEKMHRQPNSNIRIIRVKNRLDRGNKDILMNLLYRNKMVVEMQLAIKSGKSKFIQSSYSFNHYLYQMKRAPFGSIMEMCNIWVNKDLKSNFYIKKMESVNQRNRSKLTGKGLAEWCEKYDKCCRPNKSPIKIKLPFRCSICSHFYSKINSNIENIQCNKCGTEICYLCQLEMSQNVKDNLLYQIRSKIGFPISQVSFVYDKLPKLGIMLNLNGNKNTLISFYTIIENGEYHMFQFIEDTKEVKLIQKFPSQSLPQSFLRQNLIFNSVQIEQKLNLEVDRVVEAGNKYFINSYLKKTHQKQKTFISLAGKNLKQYNSFDLKIANWPSVNKLDISENRHLKDITQVIQKFPAVDFASINSINLQYLPQNIWRKLRYLQLSKNKLSSLKNLQNCPNIQQINLQGNIFVQFPPELLHLKKLTSINIKSNKLTNLPKEIDQFHHLKYFAFSTNKITAIPAQIGNLTQLRILQCFFNLIQHIPKQIGNLKHLQQLSIGSNKLSQLPEQIGNLSNLVQIFVNTNALKSLPKSISNLKSLSNLAFSSNKQIQFDDQIGKIQSLQILAMTYVGLKQLPKQIFNLTNLWHLMAAFNSIEYLPQEIANLQLLQYCNLQGNKLKSLPSAISKLKNLTSLCLYENQLTTLPQTIGDLVSLKHLILNKNKISEFPEGIKNLKNLQKLFMHSNPLTRLPASIDKLINLKFLSLRNCQLDTLPQELYNLINLQTLFISQNKQLQVLSQNVGNLTKLQLLHTKSTKIQKLPQSLAKLKHLKQLNSQQSAFLNAPIHLLQGLNILYIITLSNPNRVQQIIRHMHKLSSINIKIMLDYGQEYKKAWKQKLKSQLKNAKVQIRYQ